MQSNENLLHQQGQINSFDIENLPNNEPLQQTSYSKNIPLKAGQILGIGGGVGGYISNAILPSQEYKYSQSILQGLISQTIGNLGMSTLSIPQDEKTNLVTDNIINVSAATIGGISGALAMKLSKELCTHNIDNTEMKKFISDYVLLATFVTIQLTSKPHIKALCNKSSIFQNMADKDFLKINNIPQKTINFFINSLSGAVGAFCSSQYLASENINETAKVLTVGEVFAISQATTKTLLTIAYNKFFNKGQNR